MSVPVISLNSSPPRCLFEPGPDDAKVSLPGLRLGEVDELLDRLGRHLVADHHHRIGRERHRHRREVAHQVVRLVVVQDLEIDVRRGHDQDRVAVRRGLGGLGGADDARRAGPVLDEERLLELLAELLRDVAADEVGGSAGAERHDHLHRVIGPLRRRLGQGGSGGKAASAVIAAPKRRAMRGSTMIPPGEWSRAVVRPRCGGTSTRPSCPIAAATQCPRPGGSPSASATPPARSPIRAW